MELALISNVILKGLQKLLVRKAELSVDLRADCAYNATRVDRPNEAAYKPGGNQVSDCTPPRFDMKYPEWE